MRLLASSPCRDLLKSDALRVTKLQHVVIGSTQHLCQSRYAQLGILFSSEALLRLYLRYGLGFHAGCTETGWQRFLTPPGASAFAHQNLARQIAHHYWSAQQVRMAAAAAWLRIACPPRRLDQNPNSGSTAKHSRSVSLR